MEVTTASSYDSSTTTSTSVTDGAEATVQDSALGQLLNTISLIVYCLTFILGVLGNGAVIWVIGFKMKKTVNTVWFLNLAVADFLFVVFLPLSLTQLVLDNHWPFGTSMCKFNSMVNSLNIFASVYILVVISVDRCVSVVWPVWWAQNHRNVLKASCVSLSVWMLALIFSLPDLVFRETLVFEGYATCFIDFSLSDDYESPSVHELALYRFQAIAITRFMLGFVVPFTVIVSCYAVIIHQLRRKRALGSQSGRTFKIIAAVITMFFFCWVPFHILVLIELAYFKNNSENETLEHVLQIGFPIASSLAYANSCLNPLIYVFVGHDFRQKVCKSIRAVMEAALQGDVSPSHSPSRP